MTTTDNLWAHLGEPAGFYASDADWPGLVPEQAQALRSLELAERAEERERQEQLSERMEQSHNRAIAEAISRAHAAGQPWDPANPWEFYPSHDQRVGEAFAAMDMRAAAELRQAKQAAAVALREHGVTAQVVIDSSSPSPGVTPPSPAEPGLGPAGKAARSTASRARAIVHAPPPAGYSAHPLATDGHEIRCTVTGRPSEVCDCMTHTGRNPA